MLTTIDIAKQFSRFPGGRHISDGPASGEEFRERWLIPVLSSGSRVVVEFDGVAGLPASFLEEAFGGLVRRGYRQEQLKRQLTLRAETPRMRRYPDIAWDYIRTAKPEGA